MRQKCPILGFKILLSLFNRCQRGSEQLPYRKKCLGCICRTGAQRRWQGQGSSCDKSRGSAVQSSCNFRAGVTMSTPVSGNQQLLSSTAVQNKASEDSELALLEWQLQSTPSTHQYLGSGRFGLSKSHNAAKGTETVSYIFVLCPEMSSLLLCNWVKFVLFVYIFLHWSIFQLYLLILPTSLFCYYGKGKIIDVYDDKDTYYCVTICILSENTHEFPPMETTKC